MEFVCISATMTVPGREYVEVLFRHHQSFLASFFAVEERTPVIDSSASTPPGRSGEGWVGLSGYVFLLLSLFSFISFLLKPCGVDFILRGYVAKNVDDKIEKRLVSCTINAI